MITQNAKESANENVFKDLEGHSSQPRTSTELAIVNSLRRQYPGWSVTVTPQSTGLLPFATAGQAQAKLDKETEPPLSWRSFDSPSARAAAEPGQFRDTVIFGKYDYQWNNKALIVYSAKYTEDNAIVQNHYILVEREEDEIIDGQSKAADELIAAATQYANTLHNEVYVFDLWRWTKSKDL